MKIVLWAAMLLLALPAYAGNFDEARDSGTNMFDWCGKTPAGRMSPKDLDQCAAIGRLREDIPQLLKDMEARGNAIKVMRGGDVEFVSPKR